MLERRISKEEILVSTSGYSRRYDSMHMWKKETRADSKLGLDRDAFQRFGTVRIL